MAIIGKYCKAYPLKQLRQFSQWHEKTENTKTETKDVDDQEVEVNRELTDDDFLYLQENYVVTDGIFKDENIIFDDVTPEWKDFCHNTLEFQIPERDSVETTAFSNQEEAKASS
jgi:hypothetical protein